MTTATVYAHIKQHGQITDVALAQALGLSLRVTQGALEELSGNGQIFCCAVTRFVDGKAINETLCRNSGFVPPPHRGRKPK